MPNLLPHAAIGGDNSPYLLNEFVRDTLAANSASKQHQQRNGKEVVSLTK